MAHRHQILPVSADALLHIGCFTLLFGRSDVPVRLFRHWTILVRVAQSGGFRAGLLIKLGCDWGSVPTSMRRSIASLYDRHLEILLHRRIN
jgi:hypothetical protein